VKCKMIQGSPRVLPASEVDIHALVELFNDAFSRYYVGLKVTAESLSTLVYREDIDTASSCVALLGELPVGVAFLAVRGQRGYICGMGVRQDHQGKGIGDLLMRAVLHNASTLNLRDVTLEVVDANFRAIRLYRKFGFVRFRDVGVFLCERNRSVAPPEGVRIGAVGVRSVAGLSRAFNEMLPAWQNQVESILKFPARLGALVAHADGQALGYVVYGMAGGNLMVVDFAASGRLSPERRRHAASALLDQAWQRVQPPKGRAFNIPLGGYQEQAMQDCGYELTLRLQEMVLCLE